MNLQIAPLSPADHDGWLPLARGYKDFYQTPTSDAEYERTWQRLMAQDRIAGLGVRVDGELVGFTHYLFHTSAWADEVCYLQDLFTQPARRGQGVARALIGAVADIARQRGAARLYWLTQEHNATARRLYDQVALYKGFIRYDHPL